MQNHYETTVIITPVLSEEDVKLTIQAHLDFLKANGSEIIQEDYWGLRKLAYPIKNKTTGIYFVTEFKGPSDIIDKLELNLRRDENVLRFLTVKLDKYAIEYNDKRRKGLIGKKKEKTENS
ncbi:MAG: 30S ribosomal protein S6 [Chitinophagaceae bacterium]|jgi:small subunit ribosomal protein S6|nr:MAG: 30S ribosomal protein S6 [Chitinophagaceae bacterium]